jgi:hypothetical protein
MTEKSKESIREGFEKTDVKPNPPPQRTAPPPPPAQPQPQPTQPEPPKK